MTCKISTPKFDLAQSLAEYDRKEMRQIISAAKHLRRFMTLTQEEMTLEDEIDEEIKEFEEEDDN